MKDQGLTLFVLVRFNLTYENDMETVVMLTNLDARGNEACRMLPEGN
jgi:hypothetical protein